MASPGNSGGSDNIVGFPGRAQPGAGIAAGGGPPHDPGMEARLTRLEDQFTRIEDLLRGIDDRVRKIEVDAGELKGRLGGLPSTWAMIATVIGGQVALAGLLFGALKLGGAH